MTITPHFRHYLSLFLMAMSIIVWEILLTRIYSVVLFYHFAFMAVSIAMFGLSMGAACVALQKVDRSSESPLSDRMLAALGLLTGVLMVLAITLQLSLPIPPTRNPWQLFGVLFRTYVLSSLPFFPAGAFICLLLTRSKQVGRLYAVDLIAAGLGCALIPVLLSVFGGPGATLVAAALAGGSALCFLPRKSRASRVAWLLVVGLLLGALINRSAQVLRVRWRHNGPVPIPLFEKWNSFSRIMIQPGGSSNLNWGVEETWRRQLTPAPQLQLEIDSGAGTAITHFDGRLEPLRFLQYDITSFAHYLRPQSKVLIIGPGGGRDVLAALSFKQVSVHAVEVNPSILYAVNDVFGDFTGRLNKRPDVHFVVDEGRSYLHHEQQPFDIIQASLVDTVAATASGAYSFVENGLYTVEAWRLFLHRLTPRGLLSFSRWYFGSTTWPVEVCRTVALAAEALRQESKRPQDHILVIRNSNLRPPKEGIATVLVSREPFSSSDWAKAFETCRRLHCEIALAKGQGEPLLASIVGTTNPRALYAELPLDISPPSDNKPYFFFHARLRDILRFRQSPQFGASGFNLPAVRILVELSLITLALSALMVVWPYRILSRRTSWAPVPARRSVGMPFYFGLIGLAFMFLEIGWMQRFSLFLGHPTYGFTVILLGLLVMSGLGSWWVTSTKLLSDQSRRWIPLLLIPLLLISNRVVQIFLPQWMGSPLEVRILITLLSISPPAIVMGMFFPLAMAPAQRWMADRVGWLWAINGALSVTGSVLAMVCSLAFGISGTLMLGTGAYFLAAILLLLL